MTLFGAWTEAADGVLKSMQPMRGWGAVSELMVLVCPIPILSAAEHLRSMGF
jgi:hypothetical protein